MIIEKLPSLMFLDDRSVTDIERKRNSKLIPCTTTCYQTADVFSTVPISQGAKMGTDLSLTRQQQESTKLYSNAEEAIHFYKRKQGSVYGRLKYKYLGKNSEGNRFIQNSDL